MMIQGKKRGWNSSQSFYSTGDRVESGGRRIAEKTSCTAILNAAAVQELENHRRNYWSFGQRSTKQSVTRQIKMWCTRVTYFVCVDNLTSFLWWFSHSRYSWHLTKSNQTSIHPEIPQYPMPEEPKLAATTHLNSARGLDVIQECSRMYFCRWMSGSRHQNTQVPQCKWCHRDSVFGLNQKQPFESKGGHRGHKRGCHTPVEASCHHREVCDQCRWD